MPNSLSRREFLKLLKVGGATTIALSGCGRLSRKVVRRPYREMPEYQLPGERVHYATACQECPAGCGLVVRTVEGRAIKVEGKEDHPVNHGGTCSRGQAAVQGLYDPDRFQGPVQQAQRGSGEYQPVNWSQAVETISGMLGDMDPQEAVFLMGLTKDHVYDFFYTLSQALGTRAPYRIGALGLFEARATLAAAAGQLFGKASIPYFDLSQADVALSFGANFTETWLSPVAYSHAYGEMRQGQPTRRGLLFHFESRMSQTGANADKWIPIKPGSEGAVALVIGKIAAQVNGETAPEAFARADVDQVAQQAGIPVQMLQEIGELYGEADRKVALPGGQALAHSNGYENALSILTLNSISTEGKDQGGMVFIPQAPVNEEVPGAYHSLQDVQELINIMNEGQIETLFVYGVDPLFELPEGIGLRSAMENISSIISFSSFKNDTALMADYVFPDHTSLESWGYQKHITASDRVVLSGSQPVVGPLHNTESTIDVFLSAIEDVGGELREAVPFTDEVEYLQDSVQALMTESGVLEADVIEGFWSKFLQNGGWWARHSDLETAQIEQPLDDNFQISDGSIVGEDSQGELFLNVYPLPTLGDGQGANRPWLQETPNAMTTVMWNIWVEIHPEKAHELGIKNGDVLEVTSSQGSIEAVAYLYPGIRPDTIAIPYGQGHKALGRYAEGRGDNPLAVLQVSTNQAGDMAYGDTRVSVRRTGESKSLSRYENKEGVYGPEREE